jgi:hypothetical protein
MHDDEIFRLQNKMEALKQRRGTRIPTRASFVAAGLMGLGIVLSLLGLPQFGYKLALAGFAGFVILYSIQGHQDRRQRDIEYQIQEIERKLEDLQRL